MKFCLVICMDVQPAVKSEDIEDIADHFPVRRAIMQAVQNAVNQAQATGHKHELTDLIELNLVGVGFPQQGDTYSLNVE
jgi:hypothetical protein